jgi:hypothetical protein
MLPILGENINQRYIQSFSDEPKKLLPPIFGYARGPLLSLEEACEPLLYIVPRLPSRIAIAKENAKDPADGLTLNESAAIRLYTMEWKGDDGSSPGSLYIYLNRSLRAVDRTVLKPWFPYLKLFLTALAKLKMKPNQIVWRGIPGDLSSQYTKGSEVTWWGFSSCTTSLNVLQSPLYLGNVGAKTLFSIETFNGRKVDNHSQFHKEDEILLLPGSCFEVKSTLNPTPGLHIIHLTQKRPPYDLLEPPFEGILMIIISL